MYRNGPPCVWSCHKHVGVEWAHLPRGSRSAHVGGTVRRRAPAPRARIVSLLRHSTTSCREPAKHKPGEQGWRELSHRPKINSLRAATPDEGPRVAFVIRMALHTRRSTTPPMTVQPNHCPDASTRICPTMACTFKRSFLSSHSVEKMTIQKNYKK